MQESDTIRTPRGKVLTLGQYFALCRASYGKGIAVECALGCPDCAPWQGGPCAWEVDAARTARQGVA